MFRGVLAIAKRELWSLVVTPRGVILFGVFGIFASFYFFSIVGRFNFIVARTAGLQLDAQFTVPTLQEFVIDRFFQMVLVSLVVVVPLITMKMLAEERRTGTYELLRTSPLVPAQILFGKFLAFEIVLLMLLSVPSALLLILARAGSPDIGNLLGGLLGLFLCGSFFGAVALLVTVRCDQQLTAAIISGGTLSGFALIHTISPLLPEYRNFLELASPLAQFESFSHGSIFLGALGYFVILTITALNLGDHFLCHESEVGASRESITPRIFGGKYLLILCLVLMGVTIALRSSEGSWGSALVLTHVIGALACLAGGLFLYGVRARWFVRWRELTILLVLPFAVLSALVRLPLAYDISDAGSNTLNEFGRSIITRLDKPLRITFFSDRDTARDRRIERLMNKVAEPNRDYVKTEVIDAARFPDAVTRLGVRAGERFVLQYGEGEATRVLRLRNESEDDLVSAILNISAPSRRAVQLVVASGTPAITDESSLGISKFARALTRENVDIVPLPIASLADNISRNLPLLLLGLREPLDRNVVSSIMRFLRSGGRALIAIDPLFTEYHRELLSELGVRALDEIVLDHDQMKYSDGAAGVQPLITLFSPHPLTNRLDRNRVLIMNGAVSVSALPEAAHVLPLFYASPGSRTDSATLDILNGVKSPTLAGDRETPLLALGLAVESDSGTPRAVVLGDTDWILNAALDYYSNRALALNAVHWLLDQTWALQMRATSPFNQSLALSEREFRTLISGVLVFFEVVFVLGGLGLFRRAARAASA